MLHGKDSLSHARELLCMVGFKSSLPSFQVKRHILNGSIYYLFSCHEEHTAHLRLLSPGQQFVLGPTINDVKLVPVQQDQDRLSTKHMYSYSCTFNSRLPCSEKKRCEKVGINYTYKRKEPMPTPMVQVPFCRGWIAPSHILE